jgi:hypothetical protein
MGSGVNITGNNSFGINLTTSATPMTISNNNTMAIMGGKVGIGTTTPEDDLVIDNGTTLEDDNYYSNYSKYGHRAYLSLLDATLYSSVYGYASTTQATNTEPFNNIGVMGEGQDAFDVGVAGVNLGGGIGGIFVAANEAAPALLVINAESTGPAIAVQSGYASFGDGIVLPDTTSCSVLGTDSEGFVTCQDMDSMGSADVADQVLEKIRKMSFWEKLKLLFNF